MDKMLIAIFVSTWLCTSTQHIYLNEKDDCNNHEEFTEQIKTILMEQKRFQHDLLTKLTKIDKNQHEIDEKIKLNNMEMKDLLTNLISTRKYHRDLDQGDKMEMKDLLINYTGIVQRRLGELSLENIDMKDFLTNLTSANKLQREADEQLHHDNREMKKILTNLTLTIKLQRQSDDTEIKDLLINLTFTSKLQREMVDQLQQESKEIKDLITKRTLTSLKLYKDCKDLYLLGHTQSGVFKISPYGNESQIDVFCDMETEGGGWTAIQKRVSASVRFNRTWTEYRQGFGNPNDSYWIGNDVIHKMTNASNSSLYVSITLQNGTTLYELYQKFSVSGEDDNYRLYLKGPVTGTLGDRMLDTGSSYLNLSGMSFSTPDRDNDGYPYNCAVSYGRGGGWWYNNCHSAYLNGPWSRFYWFFPWYPPLSDGREINETLMMIISH